MDKEQFVVIGGQYESYCYGTAATLLAAKRLATANAEHWNNWQGVHIPDIYKIEDTKIIISKGRLTSNDGQEIRIPVRKPFATKNIKTNKWEYCQNEGIKSKRIKFRRKGFYSQTLYKLVVKQLLVFYFLKNSKTLNKTKNLCTID